MLWISAIALFLCPPPSYQHAAQTSASHSISPLCRHRIGTIQPPSSPFFCSAFFFPYTLRVAHVPWQTAWRHGWLHEPPCSALFRGIGFRIESWRGEASGVRTHPAGEETGIASRWMGCACNKTCDTGRDKRSTDCARSVTACQDQTQGD